MKIVSDYLALSITVFNRKYTPNNISLMITKGTFHAKMGSIKYRNGMYLIEAEEIKKRWQEYTEELYKKYLQNQDNHNGVITDLETD